MLLCVPRCTGQAQCCSRQGWETLVQPVLSQPSQPPLQLGRYLVTKKMTNEAWEEAGGALPPRRGTDLLSASASCPTPSWSQELPCQGEDQGRVGSEAGPARPPWIGPRPTT